jgi:hypothetical protein
MNFIFEVLAILLIVAMILGFFYLFRKLSSKTQSLILILFFAVYIVAIWNKPKNTSSYMNVILTVIASTFMVIEIVKLLKAKKE